MPVRGRIRFLWLVGSLAMGSAFPVTLAKSDHAAVIVVPGRARVPVLMWGRDVSGAVIEGDWGLFRPGAVSPTIILDGPPLFSSPTDGRYYPRTGRKPDYGRLEVIPPADRPLPRPAESYFRAWSTQSGPEPITIPPPYEPPPVILAPRR